MNQYYVLILNLGELHQVGFPTVVERDNYARNLWKTLDPSQGDNVFWCDCKGDLTVGSYLDGDLD